MVTDKTPIQFDRSWFRFIVPLAAMIAASTVLAGCAAGGRADFNRLNSVTEAYADTTTTKSSTDMQAVSTHQLSDPFSDTTNPIYPPSQTNPWEIIQAYDSNLRRIAGKVNNAGSLLSSSACTTIATSCELDATTRTMVLKNRMAISSFLQGSRASASGLPPNVQTSMLKDKHHPMRQPNMLPKDLSSIPDEAPFQEIRALSLGLTDAYQHFRAEIAIPGSAGTTALPDEDEKAKMEIVLKLEKQYFDAYKQLMLDHADGSVLEATGELKWKCISGTTTWWTQDEITRKFGLFKVEVNSSGTC